MTLMFVTIQLSPHVDVKMYSERGKFNLESVAFDPNIQILPGVGVSADSLGILIDVVVQHDIWFPDHFRWDIHLPQFVVIACVPLELKVYPFLRYCCCYLYIFFLFVDFK